MTSYNNVSNNCDQKYYFSSVINLNYYQTISILTTVEVSEINQLNLNQNPSIAS